MGELRVTADLMRLKGATRLLVRDVGGVEAAGALLGISHVHVSRFQLAQDPHFISIDRVLSLEALDGVAPRVTAALADMNGHVLIAKPKIPVDGKWGGLLGEIAKDCGAAVAAVGEALSDDGAITGDEIRRLQLKEKIDEAIKALLEMGEALKLQEQAERHLRPVRSVGAS
jgi:hypothetical protein